MAYITMSLFRQNKKEVTVRGLEIRRNVVFTFWTSWTENNGTLELKKKTHKESHLFCGTEESQDKFIVSVDMKRK